jgi:hypothetical protein
MTSEFLFSTTKSTKSSKGIEIPDQLLHVFSCKISWLGNPPRLEMCEGGGGHLRNETRQIVGNVKLTRRYNGWHFWCLGDERHPPPIWITRGGPNLHIFEAPQRLAFPRSHIPLSLINAHFDLKHLFFRIGIICCINDNNDK